MPLLAATTDMRLNTGQSRRKTPRHPLKDRGPPAFVRAVKGDLTEDEEVLRPIFEDVLTKDGLAGGSDIIAVFKTIIKAVCIKHDWSVRMAQQTLKTLLPMYELEEFWNNHPNAEDYGWNLYRMFGESQAWLVKEDPDFGRCFNGPRADHSLAQEWRATTRRRKHAIEDGIQLNASLVFRPARIPQFRPGSAPAVAQARALALKSSSKSALKKRTPRGTPKRVRFASPEKIDEPVEKKPRIILHLGPKTTQDV